MRRLSTVPINLAVMRLIQKQLIPKSDPVELAEVLFSGLLKPRQSTYDFYTPPDSLRFDMLEPARQMLREDLGTTRSIEVIAELSTFIANKLGLTFQKFEARLMTNPQLFEGQDGVLVEAFARMTAEVFELSGRLGIAQQLRESQAKIRVARQQQQEKAFLDQFQVVSKTVETANLVILDGEEEARFEQVCQELDGFSLNEEKIYDLSQAAISEGIDPADVDSQVTHILNQLITPWSLDEWRSETVFVNRRGEVIERRPVLARYRDVPLIETTPRTSAISSNS